MKLKRGHVLKIDGKLCIVTKANRKASKLVAHQLTRTQSFIFYCVLTYLFMKRCLVWIRQKMS